MSALFEHHPHTANLVRHGNIRTVPGEHNHRETGGGGGGRRQWANDAKGRKARNGLEMKRVRRRFSNFRKS